MDALRAAELIRQQRRRWRSQESDTFIARRAERAYFRASVVFAVGAVAEAFISVASRRSSFMFVAASFSVSAAILFWQSRQFTKVLSLLPDLEKKTDSH
jgi:hypothetical protein